MNIQRKNSAYHFRMQSERKQTLEYLAVVGVGRERKRRDKKETLPTSTTNGANLRRGRCTGHAPTSLQAEAWRLNTNRYNVCM